MVFPFVHLGILPSAVTLGFVFQYYDWSWTPELGVPHGLNWIFNLFFAELLCFDLHLTCMKMNKHYQTFNKKSDSALMAFEPLSKCVFLLTNYNGCLNVLVKLICVA